MPVSTANPSCCMFFFRTSNFVADFFCQSTSRYEHAYNLHILLVKIIKNPYSLTDRQPQFGIWLPTERALRAINKYIICFLKDFGHRNIVLILSCKTVWSTTYSLTATYFTYIFYYAGSLLSIETSEITFQTETFIKKYLRKKKFTERTSIEL